MPQQGSKDQPHGGLPLPTVKEATTADAIDRCFSVMHELRPHLDRAGYAAQVQRQMDNHGYRLVYVEADGEVVAAAGYRIAEWLAWGRSMYVDDLVTSANVRSSGHGGQLLDWMIEKTKREGCIEFHLDSGVQRFAAHRFYLRKRMDIVAHHFAMKVG